MSYNDGIAGLIEDLKMCKIPIFVDCSRSLKLYYPNKDNCICRAYTSEVDDNNSKINLFWKDHMDIGFTKYEAFMAIKEYHLIHRKKRQRFFLKRRNK